MTNLLKELDRLIEAFPRHYTAVQDRDAVAQMIQRDCWAQFSVRMNALRQKIRCEIEKEKEATTEKSSVVQSTSSGGPGGASTYGGKGLGIAGVAWPPETRITVNGKTFCLADIDKEMAE